MTKDFWHLLLHATCHNYEPFIRILIAWELREVRTIGASSPRICGENGAGRDPNLDEAVCKL